MRYEIFVDVDEPKKRYVVVMGDKKVTEEEAIKIAASYVFKCKQDKLMCFPVYMEDENANEFYASKKKGTRKFLAVCRK